MHLATYTAYRLHETHPDASAVAVVNVFGPTDFRYIADDYRGAGDPEMGHELDPHYVDDITDFLDARFGLEP